MNCLLIRSRLVAYLDHELASMEQATVESHLATCPACAREANDLAATQKRTAAMLNNAAVRVYPSPQAWSGLEKRLEQERKRPFAWVGMWWEGIMATGQAERRNKFFAQMLAGAPLGVVAAIAFALFFAYNAMMVAPENSDPAALDENQESVLLLGESSRTPTATSTREAEATRTPRPTRTPRITRTPRPEVTRTVRPTEEPEATRTPHTEPTRTHRPTEAPEATRTVRPTEFPEATRTPRPEPTRTVRPTETPHPTQEPTWEPDPTEEPEITRTPRPEPTRTVRPTEEPEATRTPRPEPTRTVRPTEEPEATRTPRPEPTEEPEATEAPEATHTPHTEPTHEPEATHTPQSEPTHEPEATYTPHTEPTHEPEETRTSEMMPSEGGWTANRRDTGNQPTVGTLTSTSDYRFMVVLALIAPLAFSVVALPSSRARRSELPRAQAEEDEMSD